MYLLLKYYFQNKLNKLVSSEKPLFLRERLNKTYSTSAYFWGRTTSDFFLHLIFPFLSVLIPYFIIGLSLVNAGKFFILGSNYLFIFLLYI